MVVEKVLRIAVTGYGVPLSTAACTVVGTVAHQSKLATPIPCLDQLPHVDSQQLFVVHLRIVGGGRPGRMCGAGSSGAGSGKGGSRSRSCVLNEHDHVGLKQITTLLMG